MFGIVSGLSRRSAACQLIAPRLPLPLDGLDVKVQYRDDQITVKRCKGRSGATEVSLTLDATVPPAGVTFENPEQFISFLNLSVRNLTLSPKLFERLPANLQRIHTAFQPTGPISAATLACDPHSPDGHHPHLRERRPVLPAGISERGGAGGGVGDV